MTRAFNLAQKFRILVNHGAQVLIDGTLVHVAHYTYGTEAASRRYRMLRRDLNCVVMCACGCEAWAPLRDIDFDHDNEHANSGPTSVGNGRPLRRDPCHRAKTSAFAAVTGKVTKLRNKLSVTTGLREASSAPRYSRAWSWPTRPLTHPTLKRCFGGRVERRPL